MAKVIVSKTNPRWCVREAFYNLAYCYIDDDGDNEENYHLDMYGYLMSMFDSHTEDGDDIVGKSFKTIFESECGVYRIPKHLYLAAEPGKLGLFKISMEYAFPRKTKPKKEQEKAEASKNKIDHNWPDCEQTVMCNSKDLVIGMHLCIVESLYQAMLKFTHDRQESSKTEMMRIFNELFPKFDWFNYLDPVWPGVNYETETTKGRFVCSKLIGFNIQDPDKLGKLLSVIIPEPKQEKKTTEFETEKVVKGHTHIVSERFIKLAQEALKTMCATHYNEKVVGLVAEFNRMFPIKQTKNPLIGSDKFVSSIEFRDTIKHKGLFIRELERQFPDHFKPTISELERRQRYDWPICSQIIQSTDAQIMSAPNCRIPACLYHSITYYTHDRSPYAKTTMMKEFDLLFPKFEWFNYLDQVWPGINYRTESGEGRFIFPKFLVDLFDDPVKLRSYFTELFPDKLVEQKYSQLEQLNKQTKISFSVIIKGQRITMNKGYCIPADVIDALLKCDMLLASKLLSNYFHNEHTPRIYEDGRIYGEPFSCRRSIYQYCTSIKFMDETGKVIETGSNYENYEKIIEAYNEMFEPANHIKLDPKIPLLRDIERINTKLAQLDKA